LNRFYDSFFERILVARFDDALVNPVGYIRTNVAVPMMQDRCVGLVELFDERSSNSMCAVHKQAQVDRPTITRTLLSRSMERICQAICGRLARLVDMEYQVSS
jgi:hypothetical protein